MKRNVLPGILVALVALGSLQSAQVQTKEAPKVAEATLPVEPVAPLRVQVTGLTPANAKTLESALLALQADVFTCDACRVEQARAGTCPKCSGALLQVKKPVLASAAPAPADGSLTLTLNPRRHVRMSELERVLGSSSATLDRAKQALPGRLTLVVRGGTADRLQKVQRSLMESGAFTEVSGAFVAETNEMHLVVRARSSPTPPLLTEVIKTLEAQELQLTDVYFGHVRS